MTKKIPVVSRFRIFRHRKTILRNPIAFHHENFRSLGDIFKVPLGFGKQIVFTRDPGLIKQVLQKKHRQYGKSSLQTVDLAKYIGHGILTSNGEHWRIHRRMVQPAFHKRKLQGLLGTMYRAIENELLQIVPNAVQDVYPLMGNLAFQVVAKSLFGRDDIQREMEELKQITTANQRMLIREMRQPYLTWWFRVSGKIASHLRNSQRARVILSKIIGERKENGEDRDDLLDMLLKARYEDGGTMTAQQLLDEVLILFTAGFETTANALAFTLYLLAKHPEKQEKAFLETNGLALDENLGMETLKSLSYIKQCVEESMRLFPPVYYIDRECVVADEFEGYKIPENAMLLLAIYELHRDERFWERPNEFVPERFNPQAGNDRSNCYFPFGAGPRMCVGNNFAMQEMILTVASVIKKYALSAVTRAVAVEPLITLRPKEVKLRFTAR